MPPSRFAFSLLGATLAVPLHAASQPTSSQPDFIPLRGKNPSQSDRVEKPVASQRLGITVRTEMLAVIGSDGRIRFECHDSSHSNSPATTLPERESK